MPVVEVYQRLWAHREQRADELLWQSRIAVLTLMGPEDRRRMWAEIEQMVNTEARRESYQSSDPEANVLMIGAMIATSEPGWLDSHSIARETLRSQRVTAAEAVQRWRTWYDEKFSVAFFADRDDTKQPTTNTAPGIYTTTTITQ